MAYKKGTPILHVPLTPHMEIGLKYLSKTTHTSMASLAKIMLGKGVSLKLTQVNKELEYEKIMENLSNMQDDVIEVNKEPR
jgi:hypothetical protein